MLDCCQIAKGFVVHAVDVLFLELDRDATIGIQEHFQSRVSFSRSVIGAPRVSEAEDDVVGSALVQMSQELLDAKLEHHCQPRVVWLEKDADSVDFLVVRYVGKDVLEIFLVLLNSPEKYPIVFNTQFEDSGQFFPSRLPCVSNARRINEPNVCRAFVVEHMSLGSLGGGPTHHVALVLFHACCDSLQLEILIGDSKAGLDWTNKSIILFGLLLK